MRESWVKGFFMKKEKISGVYKITNPIGKIYIGQSVNIRKRWQTHKSTIKTKCASKIAMSLREYGYDNHLFEIVEICEEKELYQRETFYINLIKSEGKIIINHQKNGFEIKKYKSNYYFNIEKQKKGMFSFAKTICVDLSNGIYYLSMKEVAEATGFTLSKVNHMLNGRSPNKTSIVLSK